MSKSKRKIAVKKPEALFGRVVSILEQARGNVVRAVNSNMVLAYWLIGREIVHGMQGGEERAEYGKRVLEDLSAHLTQRFGRGFPDRNLLWFKQFYLAYKERATQTLNNVVLIFMFNPVRMQLSPRHVFISVP
jgi:hypothetical protein